MSLKDWYGNGKTGNWVDISKPKKNGKWQPCGRKDASKGAYPVCRPKSVADKLTKKEIESAVRRKRRQKDKSKSIKHAITFSGKRRKDLK